MKEKMFPADYADKRRLDFSYLRNSARSAGKRKMLLLTFSRFMLQGGYLN
jgi:hypothetical protein